MATKERITHRKTGAFTSWRRRVIQTLFPLATTDVRPICAATRLSFEWKYLLIAKRFRFPRCCRGKILSVGEPNGEGLHRAAAGRGTSGLQRGFFNRQSFGNRVWQVNMMKSQLAAPETALRFWAWTSIIFRHTGGRYLSMSSSRSRIFDDVWRQRGEVTSKGAVNWSAGIIQSLYRSWMYPTTASL